MAPNPPNLPQVLKRLEANEEIFISTEGEEGALPSIRSPPGVQHCPGAGERLPWDVFFSHLFLFDITAKTDP